MTMTTHAHTCACTLDALAEEADTVNNLQQTAAEQALSNQRRTPASVSQFWVFTAHDPPPPSSNSKCSVSADLHNSIPGGYYANPDTYGNNGPRDGPRDDPRDGPREDDDDEDNEDWIDAEGDLDPNMAILNNLTVTVSRLSRSACHNNELLSSRAKVWDPDTFNGTDPKKLWTFLSYLKGMALEWFKPDLLNTGDPANCPRWMDNWIAFIAELQSTFGPHNPVTDAEHQLDHLQIKDGHRCESK
ncbi:hypothetical protein SCLCIDRAFT_31550 [Scleroderma citrinum Foug A]|uniref:Retrotransposon gag domain-containing protein n=1 Tax=Scleroderma citrinum Foug A TaxID=1036808 RepID=A0A0C3DBT0_9AGAM|nr:hypothetical protein SCLCIDRAFT_31550 [Scleroderma citrinum Foug A]